MMRNPLAVFGQNSEQPPHFLRFRSSKVFVCIVVCIAVFTDIFLYGIIIPVVPFALEGQAHVSHSQVQYWVSVLIAVYGAALLALSPICGYIADHTTSRRSPLLVGLLALAGATIMLNIGRSIGILIAGRVLQGISAAVVWVVGLALIVDTVGPAVVGHAIGYVALAMSMGFLVAPLLGGVVFAKGGYNAVFGMAYGLIALDVVLRLVLVERKIAARWLKDDTEMQGTDADEVSRHPEDNNDTLEENSGKSSDPEKAAAPQHSALAVPSSPDQSIGYKQSWTTRLPPLITLLASPRLLASLWGILVQAAIMTSFDSVLPLFVQRTFHWDSTGAGIVFLALVVPSFIQPVVGYLSDKYGPRYPATFGFAISIPFYICLRFVNSNTISDKVMLCSFLAVLGVGSSFALAPLVAEITYVVAYEEKKLADARGREQVWGGKGAYAQAYGLFNMAFAAGCLVGPIWGGLVVERAGWGTMCWTVGLLSGAGAVPVFLFVGGWIGGTNGRPKARNVEET